jgi:hypothetical protein
MNCKFLKVIFTGLVLSASSLGNVAYAGLIDRGNGMIYDDLLDITWLQDANYAMTTGFAPDGLMTWETSMNWAENLIFGGFRDWRLFNADPKCGINTFNCTTSELGHLFYNDFDITAGESILSATGAGFDNFNLFINVQSTHAYMSGIEQASNAAYDFRTRDGSQSISNKSGLDYGWAVHDGDIGNIPEPSTIVIFALGLIGLASRRVKKFV